MKGFSESVEEALFSGSINAEALCVGGGGGGGEGISRKTLRKFAWFEAFWAGFAILS